MNNELFRSSLLVTASLLVSLILAELILRSLNIGYGNSPQESDEIYHHVHPANYRFVSYDVNGEYGGHEVYYNEKRMVSKPGVDSGGHLDKVKKDCKIAFLGDSFTEAIQVPYEKSFVGILGDKTSCDIENYSNSSYSPIFYLLQWRMLINKTNLKLIVVQLYSNDISSDEKYFLMAKKDENGEIVAIPGPGNDLLSRIVRRFYLVRFLRKMYLQSIWYFSFGCGDKMRVTGGVVEENPDITALSSRMINELYLEAKGEGVDFLLTVVPSKYALGDVDKQGIVDQFSDKWKKYTYGNNIPFLDLVKEFEIEVKQGNNLFFEKDIHFNENGHKIVAEKLMQRYPELFDSQ